jgi:uncharacterized protein YchJ
MENKKQAPGVKIFQPRDLEITGEAGWTMKRSAKKVYRNQPCTCGSGKKAKSCCYVEG